MAMFGNAENPGVPFGCRASSRLFTSKILVPKGAEYCSISQKVLKGAAARILIYWLSIIVSEQCDGSEHAMKLEILLGAS